MSSRYKKVIGRYFSSSKMIIVVSLAISIFLGTSLFKEIVNRRQIDEKIKQYKKDIANLEKENSELNQSIDSWTTSRQLEKEARLKLGLKKPGENVVLIIRDDQRRESQLINDNFEVLGGMVVESDKNNLPNYKKWWFFFFKS